MYLAIDPGGTTGLAFVSENNEWLTATASTPEELYAMINPKLKAVIIETFQANTISSYGLYTVRLVGAVEALTWYHKLPLVKRMPIHRRPYQRQAEHMLKPFVHVIHEADALAHLLIHLHQSDKTRLPLLRRDNWVGTPRFAQGGVIGFARLNSEGTT